MTTSTSLYAIVTGGIVTNIIVSDAAFAASLGAVEAQGAGIGWAYSGGVFTAPPEPPVPVPAAVTRRQARRALILSDKIDLVQPAIDAIPDSIQRKLMQADWDDSQEFQRYQPTLLALGAAIGLTSEGIDDLFRLAATQ